MLNCLKKKTLVYMSSDLEDLMKLSEKHKMNLVGFRSSSDPRGHCISSKRCMVSDLGHGG
jgi:hypothetical protein